MKNKKLSLVVFSLLLMLIIFSLYFIDINRRCIKMGADYATFGSQGILCRVVIEDEIQYIPLEELENYTPPLPPFTPDVL